MLLTSIARQQAPSTLEDLAYAAGTDKSHDDHKYVDTYAALFDPIRHAVRNVTEVGIAAGQSLQMWHSYFPNALIWGLDIAIRPSAVTRTRNLSRVSMRRCNSQNPSSVMRLGWSLRSMDLIIDDGDHKPRSNEATLLLLWPYVREGGYYVTEDVATGANADGRYDGIDHTRRIRTAPADSIRSCTMSQVGVRPACSASLMSTIASSLIRRWVIAPTTLTTNGSAAIMACMQSRNNGLESIPSITSRICSSSGGVCTRALVLC
jgi:hypothetical protein